MSFICQDPINHSNCKPFVRFLSFYLSELVGRASRVRIVYRVDDLRKCYASIVHLFLGVFRDYELKAGEPL